MTAETEDLTPEQYRIELVDERTEILNRLATIKAEIAALVASKQHDKIEVLSLERSELIADMSEIDMELRKLKAEIPKPPLQPQRHPDLGLVVQLVAATISAGKEVNITHIIGLLEAIKTELAAQ